MTLNEYKERVIITRASGFCSYTIKIKYYGKEYTCHSNNSLAWDRISESCYLSPKIISSGGLTEKQAYKHIMLECIIKNGLLY